MRAVTVALFLFGLAAGGTAAAEPKGCPSSALPQSITPYADQRSECFLPGERAQCDAAIDQTRISVPGCTKGIIPPQTTVQSHRVYKENNSHIFDCAGSRRREFNTRFLDRFLKDVVFQVDSKDGSAQCAANMLYAWAKANAMTQIGPEQDTALSSKNDIMWTLAGLSAAYFKSSATQTEANSIADPMTQTADAAIKQWFANISGSIADDIIKTRATSKENNIQYWRAWSILPTAMLLQDPVLLNASQGVFVRAMKSVAVGNTNPSDNGFLQLELKRGDKALRYQVFATVPLVAMAIVSQAYGCEFLDWPGAKHSFVSLMTRTIQGSAEPEIFSAQQLQRGLTRRLIQQLPSPGAAKLLNQIDRVDPALGNQIDTALATQGVKPSNASLVGTDQTRIGGDFSSLADASAALHARRSPRFAGVCGAPG